MNSSKNTKHRRRVISARSRKLSSTSNRSQLSLSHVKPAGRRRITAVLKNNKALALALQDARCELSVKEKLLEDVANHFNNITLARNKMLEMHSILKSFMKDFDDTILLLKVDDAKWPLFKDPTRYHRKFKTKMKKIVESINEVPEANSISFEREIQKNTVGITEKSSNQVISNKYDTANIDSVPMEVAEELSDEIRQESSNDLDMKNAANQKPVEDQLLVSIRNTISNNARNATDIIDNQLPSDLFCKDSGGIMDSSIEEKISSAKSVSSLIDRESFGTPKLSIVNNPVMKSVSNAEATSEFKTCLSYENFLSPLVKKLSKIVVNPPVILSSQKVLSSKIPTYRGIPIRTEEESKISDTISKEKPIYERNFDEKDQDTIKDFDSDICRRKTFVIKNSGIPTTNSDLSVLDENISNQKEILNKNTPIINEQSEKNSHRKTFVVKNLNIPENTFTSQSGRRKTFVKKSIDNINRRTSMRNRRDTFRVSETIKEYTNQSENFVQITENLVYNDTILNEAHMHNNEIKKFQESSSIHINASESVQPTIPTGNSEEFQNSVDNTKISDVNMILPQVHSQEVQQNIESVKEVGETRLKIKEVKVYDNVDVNENSLKDEELIEIVSCDAANLQNEIEILDINATCHNDEQDSLENGIEILDTGGKMHATRTYKRVSYKPFLESSDSDCESIPDPDIDIVKQVSSIKTTPIRRHISGTKNKVFVFDANKRMSVLSKKSLGRLCEKSENLPDFSYESNTHQSNIHSISIKNANSINVCEAENPNRKKERKSVRFKNDEVDSTHCDISTSRQISKAPSISETSVRKNAKHDYTEKVKNKDNFTSKIVVSNYTENVDKSMCAAVSHNYSPVIISDKIANIIENENKNLHLNRRNSKEKFHAKSKKSCVSNEITCNMKNNKADKKNKVKRNAKQKPSKNDIPIDDIIVTKKVKRNNSKKQPEENVLLQEEKIPSHTEENEMSDLLVKNKSDIKTKKHKKNVKSKIKKKSLNTTDKNAIIVQAEVHPPPRFLNIPETEILKENKEVTGLKNYQVSVVLSDVFESRSIDMLNLCKNQLSESRTFPSKTLLSDNSSNIPTSVVDCKNIENVASHFEEISTRKGKRNRCVNYQEPSLRKKLRQ